MNNFDEIAGLLREIRDELKGREQQYADHLKQVRDEYDRQLAHGRQERERSINRLTIIGGIVAAIGYALYKWG
jgi:hypothetical protein